MDLKALRILVVDDNRHAAEIVKSILGSLGAQDVRQATTAHQAFETLQREMFDMTIVDQNLGKGDEGIHLVRRIRNDPQSPSPYMPILMLTGYTEHRRVTAARDAGVSEFLSKPFTVAGLLRRIDALIQNPRPFVRSGDYFGPDRRRRADPKYTGPDRRKPQA
ncbi:MAG: chemotaxis receiver domain protein CheYIII [Phenylobacterium sp.]|nr:chemotaxis receiver domain protein CheYIII [Phenylobacterium sp.]